VRGDATDERGGGGGALYPDPVTEYAIPAREYALVFGAALVLTFLLTGVVRVVATKLGAVTPIRERDVHALPIPRMGGVAVYAGFAAAVLMALQLPALGSAFVASSEILGVLVAGGLICLVGVLDDRFDLDAIAKLAGQIVAAGVLVLFGVQWQVIWLPDDGPTGGSLLSLDQTQAMVLTVLLTVVLTNAMNFIDGLDGLLAGVAAISACAIFVFSVRQLQLSGNDLSASQPPLIAAALMGACIGFLPHNFSPARIFMGDSGAMFVGLAMAAAIVSAGGKLDTSTFGPRSTIALLAPLIVALAVVFIPMLDFLLAVIRRTKDGRHPFSADKQHLHHRMLAIGHTHRQAVLLFYLWAFVLAGGAVALVFVSWQVALAPFLLLAAIALGISVWPRVRSWRAT
jgi:UDP-GlcNAc:undecaprenyl-phosphate/decaprenyl-phosphate GlcNAc-1-phosphate transferase